MADRRVRIKADIRLPRLYNKDGRELDAGLTLEELAALTGATYPSVYTWESNSLADPMSQLNGWRFFDGKVEITWEVKEWTEPRRLTRAERAAMAGCSDQKYLQPSEPKPFIHPSRYPAVRQYNIMHTDGRLLTVSLDQFQKDHGFTDKQIEILQRKRINKAGELTYAKVKGWRLATLREIHRMLYPPAP